MDKIILHSDLNNFYASCECVLHPELAKIPMAVGGDSDKRHGVVLAKNQLAKAYGVKTAETKAEALKKCPTLTFVPPHHQLYDAFSKKVKDIYYSFTDRIEPFSLDECWLDVTGSTRLFGSGPEIAQKIRETVKHKTGLTVSVGVSFTKTFAKLGSDMKKPDAVTVIDRSNYRVLAWSLPVSELMYVGRRSADKLRLVNINTIGDIARAPNSVLQAALGANGLKLKEAALGVNDDEVPVYGVRPAPKSVGHGTTTYRDMTTLNEVRTVLYALSDMVAARLRRYGLGAGGVQVGIKDSKLAYFARQTVLPAPTRSAAVLAEAAFRLFTEHYDLARRLPVRALAVYTYALTEGGENVQMDMFSDGGARNEKLEHLERSIDGIRARFGTSAITRAGFLGNQFVLDSFTDDGNDDLLPFHRG